MIRDLQSSERIKEHLEELQGDYNRSNHKNLVQQFINFWEYKYVCKLAKELELINN
jgi:hypothetical protein